MVNSLHPIATFTETIYIKYIDLNMIQRGRLTLQASKISFQLFHDYMGIMNKYVSSPMPFNYLYFPLEAEMPRKRRIAALPPRLWLPISLSSSTSPLIPESS
jgi:hypothetical protein